MLREKYFKISEIKNRKYFKLINQNQSIFLANSKNG